MSHIKYNLHMLFKISIKYYETIIFSLFSFVKRYAVRNVKIRQYAVRRVKIRQYAVRKGGGGCHPHLSFEQSCLVELKNANIPTEIPVVLTIIYLQIYRNFHLVSLKCIVYNAFIMGHSLKSIQNSSRQVKHY